MKTTTALLLGVTSVAHAGPRTSSDYRIATDSIDAAGIRSASAAYTNAGSVGGVDGVSSVASPVVTVKAGYLGQLYEVTTLQLTASPVTVNEGSTRQLSGSQLLDDLTTLTVPATSIGWSVTNGPLSIDVNGLATAATVYQSTAATVQGIFGENAGTLGLTVLDALPDNFGSYAGDEINDAWQVQYFGPGNPLAAALLDPDGDGQNNLFEFTAGVVPTDPDSRFILRAEAVPGLPGQYQITFSPRLPDRDYSILTSTTLLGDSWMPLVNGVTSDRGAERTVRDANVSEEHKFYRLGISKP